MSYWPTYNLQPVCDKSYPSYVKYPERKAKQKVWRFNVPFSGRKVGFFAENVPFQRPYFLLGFDPCLSKMSRWTKI
jgi:hypothetical protein